MLAPQATALDGDRRRHDRRGGRRTQEICRRTNAPPHVRVSLYFTTSTHSIASTITQGGRGLYTRAHRHARDAPRLTHLPLATPRTLWLARAPRALTRSPRPVHAPYAAHALVFRQQTPRTRANTRTHAHLRLGTHARTQRCPGPSPTRPAHALACTTRQARHGLFPTLSP